MPYRSGGGGMDSRGRQHGGPAPTAGFVCPPPVAGERRPRPARAPVPYGVPATVVYHNPAAMKYQMGAYQHGVVTPPPTYYFKPAPVTIQTASPRPSPTAAPFQPAQDSCCTGSAPAPASTSALAKELEQKLFLWETALAPPAAAAAALVVASPQQGSDATSDVYNKPDLASVSKKGLAHPARPGPGTAGKKISIFWVSKARATSREVLNELIKPRGKTSLGGKLPPYDGRKSLYTAGALPFESEEFIVILVDPEKKDKERAEREYMITIRIAGRTNLYHLQQFLCGRQGDMPQETIQVLYVVPLESSSWNYVTLSRSFFSTSFGHRGDIGEGLECWRGYYQNVSPTQMGLSLNIDISAASFLRPVTVIQFVQEFLNLRDCSRLPSDRDRVKIKKALGVHVETNHQQDQIRRYKITGITPIPLRQLIFPVDEVRNTGALLSWATKTPSVQPLIRL